MFSRKNGKFDGKKISKKKLRLLCRKRNDQFMRAIKKNQFWPISSLPKKSLMLLKLKKLFLFSFSMAQFGFADIVLGCASCDCNQNGSIGAFCDTHTGQCPCKLGVEGLKCDSCADEFYGHSNGCQGNLLNIIHVNNSDW